MNTIILMGEVRTLPVYHCTARGRDLARIQLTTYDRRGGAHTHHCTAWGPAALDLHKHLKVGDRLAVKGELLYRAREVAGQKVAVPYVLIRSYSYAGVVTGASATRLTALQ
jgi:single-stranded DNA-binding protein